MKSPAIIPLILFSFLASVPVCAQAPSLYQQGLMALQQNRPSDALAALTAAEGQNPRDAAIRNFRGIALAQLGRNDEARSEYREAIQLNPRLTDACRNLGHLEWTDGHAEAARSALKKALEISPDDPFAHYYLARVELDAQNYPQAVGHLDKSKSVWPSDAGFYLEAAEGYASAHRTTDARALLARVQQADLSAAKSVLLGILHITCQQPDEAIAVFQRLKTQSMSADWSQIDLALAYLQVHQPAEAQKAALSIAKENRSREAWTLIGIAEAEMQRHEDAIQAFRSAAEIAPQEEDVWLNLTRELMEELHYVDAVAAAQEAASHVPRSYALRLRLGAAYMKAARYQEAEQVFRDLIDKGDPEPTSAVGLAQVLMREGKPEDAAGVLDEAEKRLGPTFLLAYFRGIMLSRAGKPREALEPLLEAVRLNPHSAVAYQWLGKAELQASQTDKAIVDLNQALKLDPGNQAARRLLARAYAIRKQPDQAEKYLREIKPDEVPRTVGEESADFLIPAWEMPPAAP
jgi:tetratricopeptide (TPR) repeat protein